RPVERERVEWRRASQREGEAELPGGFPIPLPGGPARVPLVEPTRWPGGVQVAVQRDVGEFVAEDPGEVVGRGAGGDVPREDDDACARERDPGAPLRRSPAGQGVEAERVGREVDADGVAALE